MSNDHSRMVAIIKATHDPKEAERMLDSYIQSVLRITVRALFDVKPGKRKTIFAFRGFRLPDVYIIEGLPTAKQALPKVQTQGSPPDQELTLDR